MEPVKVDLSDPEDRSKPFDLDATHAFVLPKQESDPAQPTTAETQTPVDVNATALNQVTEMQPVLQATPVVESAPVRPPNITETSDHPLPAGTSYAELQAKLAASQEQTKQVLLPQQPVTEAPKSSFKDKLPKWLRFGT
jgi:hypothetical protein